MRVSKHKLVVVSAVVLVASVYASLRLAQVSEPGPPVKGHLYRSYRDLELPDDVSQLLLSHTRVPVFVSTSLLGELEPCGCTKPQRGGLSRRDKFLDSLRESRSYSEAIYIDCGNAFYRPDSRFLITMPQLVLRQGRVVRDFFAEANTAACGVAASDIVLGADYLHKMGVGELPLVSTNATSRDLPLERSKRIPLKDRNLLFLSVVDGGSTLSRGPSGDGFGLDDPLQSLRAECAQGPPPDVVLLAVDGTDVRRVEQLCKEAAHFAPTLAVDSGNLFGSLPTAYYRKLGGVPILTPRSQGTDFYVIDLYLAPQGAANWYDIRDLLTLYELKAQYAGMAKAATGRNAKTIEAGVVNNDRAIAAAIDGLSKLNVLHIRCLPISLDWQVSQHFEMRIAEFKREAEEMMKAVKSKGVIYESAETCGKCHVSHYENWKTTLHARAYQTLVEKGEAGNPRCTECHITGYGLPGGPLGLEEAKPLRAVQCGSCHVPTGVKHPETVSAFLPIRSATCLSCHTKDQDPYFVLETYLRHGTCQQKLNPGEEHVPRSGRNAQRAK